MLDLTRLSFEELVDQLKLKLKQKNSWKDVVLASTGTTIVELYAYIAQLVLYYLKRTAEELLPSSARYWESLVKIANMLSVHVKRPYGAEGLVKLKLKTNYSQDEKFIPAYTIVRCQDTFLYTAEPAIVEKGYWKEVSVRQGEKKVATFTVRESKPCVKLALDDTTASYQDIVVKSGSIVYDVVTDLFEPNATLPVRVITLPDKRLQIMFYTNITPLSVGQQISVEYYSVKEGWMPPVGATWAIDDSDVEIMPVEDSFVPGTTWETTEELRLRLLGFFSTGKRVVTPSDLEKFVRSVDGVEKVKVLDVKNLFKAPFGGARVYVKPVGSWTLSTPIRRRIEAILSNISLLGVTIELGEVQKVDLDLYLIVYEKKNVPDAVLKAEVTEALHDFYSKVEVGQWITRYELKSYLESIGYRVYSIVYPEKDWQLRDYQCLSLRNVRVEIKR